MKRETIKNIIFICVIFLLIILLICSVYNNSGTDSKYRDAIKERDKTLTELTDTIEQLNTANTELENIKSDTDAIIQRLTGTIQQLNKTIAENGIIIESLQNIRDTITGENTAIETEVEGIGRILQKVKTQKQD